MNSKHILYAFLAVTLVASSFLVFNSSSSAADNDLFSEKTVSDLAYDYGIQPSEIEKRLKDYNEFQRMMIDKDRQIEQLKIDLINRADDIQNLQKQVNYLKEQVINSSLVHSGSNARISNSRGEIDPLSLKHEGDWKACEVWSGRMSEGKVYSLLFESVNLKVFSYQFFAFKDLCSASDKARELISVVGGFPVFLGYKLINGQSYYCVMVGAFAEEQDARNAKNELKSIGRKVGQANPFIVTPRTIYE